MHALAIAYATPQYTPRACMHLPFKHRAVLAAPQHAQLPSASGCIWLVIVSKIWDPQLCSHGIHPAVEVFGTQTC